jgi:hypothetical protein
VTGKYDVDFAVRRVKLFGNPAEGFNVVRVASSHFAIVGRGALLEGSPNPASVIRRE